jgi:S-DNA-T family DNA segregation ATPase FtsK/SpoIIIE
MAGGGKITRVHGPFVSDSEVERVAEFVRKQGKPEYIEDVTISDEEEDGEEVGAEDEGGGDEMYRQAKELVLREKKVSVSYVQRALRIGYNRAANIVEQLEKDGIVSEPDHSGKRKVVD